MKSSPLTRLPSILNFPFVVTVVSVSLYFTVQVFLPSNSAVPPSAVIAAFSGTYFVPFCSMTPSPSFSPSEAMVLVSPAMSALSESVRIRMLSPVICFSDGPRTFVTSSVICLIASSVSSSSFCEIMSRSPCSSAVSAVFHENAAQKSFAGMKTTPSFTEGAAAMFLLSSPI